MSSRIIEARHIEKAATERSTGQHTADTQQWNNQRQFGAELEAERRRDSRGTSKSNEGEDADKKWT